MSFANVLFLVIFSGLVLAQNSTVTRKSQALFPRNCGLRKLSGGGRTASIVNGDDAAFGEFPWMVLLMQAGSFRCGGVLINSQWALTAAHCYNRSKAVSEYSLSLGQHNRRHENEPLPTVTLKVSKIVRHPEYIAGGFQDGRDIALFKASTKVQFKRHIQPICLPYKGGDEGIEGEMAKVSGWGMIFYDGRYPDVLQKVSLPILNVDICRSLYLRKELFPISKDVMCAGYANGKASFCRGDSGGPLQRQREDGSWALLGLVSWQNVYCASRDGIGIFTRVSTFVPWIRRVLIDDYET